MSVAAPNELEAPSAVLLEFLRRSAYRPLVRQSPLPEGIVELTRQALENHLDLIETCAAEMDPARRAAVDFVFERTREFVEPDLELLLTWGVREDDELIQRARKLVEANSGNSS